MQDYLRNPNLFYSSSDKEFRVQVVALAESYLSGFKDECVPNKVCTLASNNKLDENKAGSLGMAVS